MNVKCTMILAQVIALKSRISSDNIQGQKVDFLPSLKFEF